MTEFGSELFPVLEGTLKSSLCSTVLKDSVMSAGLNVGSNGDLPPLKEADILKPIPLGLAATAGLAATGGGVFVTGFGEIGSGRFFKSGLEGNRLEPPNRCGFGSFRGDGSTSLFADTLGTFTEADLDRPVADFTDNDGCSKLAGAEPMFLNVLAFGRPSLAAFWFCVSFSDLVVCLGKTRGRTTGFARIAGGESDVNVSETFWDFSIPDPEVGLVASGDLVCSVSGDFLSALLNVCGKVIG